MVTNYEPPKLRDMKKGKVIVPVEPASTPEDIVNALRRKKNNEILDLENCVLLSRHPEEMEFYEIYRTLPSDTELINWADERDWNKYGNFWEIKEFDAVHSNLLKYAWSETLRNRKEFINRVKHPPKKEGELPFYPRYRYDAVKQDWHPKTGKNIYNAWDYLTLFKGAAKFHNEHAKGKHLDIPPIPQAENCWILDVPSDADPNEMYQTVIGFIPGKEKVIRNLTNDNEAIIKLTGSDNACSCPDYLYRKRQNQNPDYEVNPICKHIVYAYLELLSHGLNVKETIPVPTANAWNLKRKIDNNIRFPGGKRTDASTDAIVRAYIDKEINNIGAFFTTNPAYVRKIHSSYKQIVV